MSLSQKEQSLRQLIADKIAATPNQRISFADYMDLVLYHPQQGYYATGAVNIGSEGDFFTSSHLGHDFGELLAEQFAQMWEILEQPKPFTLVEMGAGQGLVAADVLTYLHRQYPDCFAALDYIIIEKAAGLIKKQQQVLNQLNIPELPLRWCTFDDLPDHSIIGCCFSNELVDAFPVHQVVLEKGQLQEVYVTTIMTETNEIHFGEVIDDLSTPQLKDYFQWMGIDLYSGAYPDGYRSEVNLAALDWIKTIASKLNQGFLLTIDYGYSADRYYLPVRHQGTLKCYYQHRHHDNPYVNIGQQDMTAHVNFTALERQGELSGLQPVELTKQGLFLMALGLGDRISALSAGNQQGQAIAGAQDVIRIMRRRDALHQLIDPTGLGGFMVLVQSKGLSLEKARSLKGLTIPPIV
ncbi:MAG: class I SAM-dependent methyltransferase [Coleofasciculus sp. G3-WIS-01]|uniref:class I SAM-dependent methyltransferase n=1 Tax=Coleofasciculus sp. G3-WIS-01 TaxID=3069528 RepID=UPI0032F670F5